MCHSMNAWNYLFDFLSLTYHSMNLWFSSTLFILNFSQISRYICPLSILIWYKWNMYYRLFINLHSQKSSSMVGLLHQFLGYFWRCIVIIHPKSRISWIKNSGNIQFEFSAKRLVYCHRNHHHHHHQFDITWRSDRNLSLSLVRLSREERSTRTYHHHWWRWWWFFVNIIGLLQCLSRI